MPKILKKNGNFIWIVRRINASFSPFLNFVLLGNQVLSSFGCLQFEVLALIACQFGFVFFTCVHVLCLVGCSCGGLKFAHKGAHGWIIEELDSIWGH